MAPHASASAATDFTLVFMHGLQGKQSTARALLQVASENAGGCPRRSPGRAMPNFAFLAGKFGGQESIL